MSFELNKKLAAKREPLKTTAKVDPVTAAIIRGGFETVCYEAATFLGRAATTRTSATAASSMRMAGSPAYPSARRTWCSCRSSRCATGS